MAESQAKRVRRYVQTLSQQDRYIVMLYFADGLTPMEISRVLDLPSSQVRTRLDQLRNQLTNLTNANTSKTPKPALQPKTPPATTAQAYA